MNSSTRSLPCLGALAILAVLCWVSPVAEAGADKAEVQEGTVSALRGEHATIEFVAQGPTSIELHGRLVDEASRRPLSDAVIEVVRFEAPDEKPVVTVEDVMALPASAKDVIRRTTESEGRFVLSDLAPGRYSLQVAWDDVPAEAQTVRWELRWVERPSAAADGDG